MKAGDKVVCINGDGWEDEFTFEVCEGPSLNEELVIHSLSSNGQLIFGKYGLTEDNSYYSDNFRKLVSHGFKNSITAELAREEIKRGIERIEKPIRKPELV